MCHYERRFGKVGKELFMIENKRVGECEAKNDFDHYSRDNYTYGISHR